MAQASRHRGWWIALAVIVGLGVIVAAASFFAEEPLRRYAERQANDRLPDYRMTIGALALHPFTLTVDLRDMVVRQRARPEPALAVIPQLTADAKFFPLLTGIVAADVDIERPVLAATRQQIDAAVHQGDAEEAKEQAVAWQDRLREVMPFRIDLSITDGQVTYEGAPLAEPVRVQRLSVQADNLTNRLNQDEPYPSDLHVQADFLDQARIAIDGRADPLAKPHPGLEAQVKVQDLHLDSLLPVAERFNVQVRQGLLDLSGRVEYSSTKTKLLIDQLILENAKVDYVHASGTADKEPARLKQGARHAQKAHRNPAVLVKVEHGKILRSEMGFVNKAVSPDYRVFLADMNAEMDNFSTRPEEGTGVVKMTGKFMGSGPTTVTGTFRPEKPRPDFTLDVRIIKTQVKAFNNVLRAYGDVDTTAGTFALFSELSVKDNRIDGYVKPFLKDVEVYDPRQDKDKATTQKLYEAVVGGVLEVFENQPRDEVATKTDVSGQVDNPQADTWEILMKLVQNAFFKAIFPGFEGQAGKA